MGVGQPELALFWPALLVAIGALEVPFLSRIDYETDGQSLQPALRAGVVPGDLGFDPLNQAGGGSDPERYTQRRNAEILHGRLAMISAAGMIAQELFTQSKLGEGGI